LSRRSYEYLLSLGSNIEPSHSVARGLDLLARRFDLGGVSPRYDVAAVGAPDAPRFLNLAVRIRTDLTLRPLREACRRIEEACGRRRSENPMAPRTLDVDVVFAAPGVPSAPGLPHVDVLQEAYVLWPCAVVWPDAVHPEAGRTLRELAVARFPGWEAAHRIGPAPWDAVP